MGLTECNLRDLVRDLGAEWEEVGTRLQFQHSRIQRFKTDNTNTSNAAFDMLVTWSKQTDETEHKDLLLKALVDTGRNDLAKKIQGKSKTKMQLWKCCQLQDILRFITTSRGGSRYAPIRPCPPSLLTAKSCKFSLFLAISANSPPPPHFDPRPHFLQILDPTLTTSQLISVTLRISVCLAVKNSLTYQYLEFHAYHAWIQKKI